jgi:hypothetical protein
VIVHLVTGTSGEYSDRVDWNVRAFVLLEEAEAFRAKLQGIVEKTEAAVRNDDIEWEEQDRLREAGRAELTELDSRNHWYSYEGACYHVEAIELVGTH